MSISMGLNTVASTRANELIHWLRGYAKERINSAAIDERRSFPPYLVLDLGNHGVLGMLAEQRYGGLGFGHVDTAAVLEQLGAIDTTIALFTIQHNYLGIRPIARYALPEVRDELLPRLSTGRELAAFALTEPGAGSNPRAMESRAETVGAGQWRLYGTKQWIGSAQWASVLNVFAREGSTHLVGGHIVRQGAAGLRMGPEAPTMGLRGMIQNTVFLEGVQTSRRDRLGSDGKGMEVAEDAMSFTRLAIGALCIGAIRRCAQLALHYAERRQISTGSLLANPTTLAKLGRMTAATYALDRLIYRLASAADVRDEVPVEGLAACKVAAPEFLGMATDDLMQLVGGRGYMEDTPIPQLVRDARVLRIFERPTENMEAFLGARLMGNSSSLARLLRETLAAPELLPRLDELASAVQAASEQLKEPLAKGSVHWGQARAGRLATWLILQAAIEGDAETRDSSESQRAAAWVRAHLDQQLRFLTHGTPEDASYLAEPTLREIIVRFESRIGNGAQALQPMSSALDALLERGETSLPLSLPPADATRSSPTPKASSALQPAELKRWIVTWLARHSRLPESEIDTARSFADLGLDSLMTLELTRDLSRLLGVELEETLLWDAPTIDVLALSISDLQPGSAGKQRARADEASGREGIEDELRKLEEELSMHRGR
jgi:alkylation response protein AidB-like acyl-CoA dehydrogenase/acyl carrier protein